MPFSINEIKKLIFQLFKFNSNEGSASIAKNRLKLVLVNDRVKISPQQMDKLKQDLIEAISRYVDIDKEQLEVCLTRKEKSTSLIVNIPVKVRKKEKSVLRRLSTSRKDKR